MADTPASMSEITHTTGFGSSVNSDEIVTIYDEHGNELMVKQSQVDDLISQGYRRNKLDIAETLTDFKALIQAASDAVSIFINGVMSDEDIDTSDESNAATASEAMRLVAESYDQLISDTFKRYPVRQGSGVKMSFINDDGVEQETEVDPGQVDHYESKGHQKI